MRRIAVVLTAVLLAAGCTKTAQLPPKAPTPALQRFYGQELTWSDCGDGFDCTRMTVPLDYDNPSGQTIKISVIRLRATGDRIGSLLINPGGPGGSGIQYARAARSVLSKNLLANFDAIGFDPRGVGESTPIRCVTGKQLDAFVSLDASPDSKAEVTALESGSKAFAEACGAKAAQLLPHVGTADAARDMDVLRAVLGDAKMTYLGKSYGTYLGAAYANLFPKNVRALVLDGAVDPVVPALEANEVQAEGFEVALKAFAADCFKAAACPFTSRDVDGAMKEISDLLARADREPLTNDLGDGRQINEALTVLGIVTPLYDRGSWPVLRQALGHAFKGNGTDLLRMADVLVDRRPDGSYSNQTEANLSVNCLDHPYPRAVSDYTKAAEEAAKVAPHFGSFVMLGSLPCAYWPVPATGKDEAFKAVGAPPIVVIGTKRDPATPYSWAEGLASELSSGVLLAFDGDGHTAYKSGSPCVDNAVDTYLINLKPPAANTLCPKVQ